MRLRLWVAVSLIFIILVSAGCSAVPRNTSSGFDSELNTIVHPYTFNFALWELGTWAASLKRTIFNRQPAASFNSQSVIQYFSYVAELNSMNNSLKMVQAEKISDDITRDETQINGIEAQLNALKPVVEQTIANQINQVLADQGIYNPFGISWLKLNFPQVNFKLEEPLNELIISPLDKIERIRSITLIPGLTTARMEAIESSADKLNVSALVVQIGGFGATYPAFVVNNSTLKWTIDTAAHEWTHQYLAFKPLGFHYVLDLLGISKNYSIDTINETVADIVGSTIGSMVYNRYYAPYLPASPPAGSQPAAPVFDFNAAMRHIRQKVDSMLAQGQIDQAEKYMDEQQQFLASKGYYIRKLNQAYFAFYGTYADSATSIDPVGRNISTLRAHSLSLKDFLEKVSEVTSSQELSNLVSSYK